jgi:serine/threonine protein kinase
MTYQKHCPSCFRLKDAIAVCPHCGFDESATRSTLFLAYGTVLAGQYRVGRVLGKPGGFGITYQGWDINLQQRVAIKEFMPPEIAERMPHSADVTVMAAEERKNFENGKAAFLREARVVAQLDHPNVVRVRTFFNANDTAYLVMDYYDGMTMADYLADKQPTLGPELAIPVMLPILDGLRYLHARGLIHRDIKPHNIYLATMGRAILLDFGAARQAAAEGDPKTMSVALSSGYAPLEQYQRRSSQGPWTDVYGAAATLYRMMTGQAPPTALDRLTDDPLANGAWPGVPDALRRVLIKALAQRAEDRYPTAEAFMVALEQYSGGEPVAHPPAHQPPPPGISETAPSAPSLLPTAAPPKAAAKPAPTTMPPPRTIGPLPGWRRAAELVLLTVGGALIIAFFLWLMFLRPPDAYSPPTGSIEPTQPVFTRAT